MGVADGRTEELESPFFHVFAHGVGFGRRYRKLAQRPEVVDNRFPVGEKGQCVVVKAAEFFLYGKKLPCIGNGRFDFQTVSHNAVKQHQPFHIFVSHECHLPGIEIAEGFAVSFPLLEDGYPAQSGLSTFQYKKLE